MAFLRSSRVPSLARIINILWKIATLANVLAFIYAKISYAAIIKVTIKDFFQVIEKNTLLQEICLAHNRELSCQTFRLYHEKSYS